MKRLAIVAILGLCAFILVTTTIKERESTQPTPQPAQIADIHEAIARLVSQGIPMEYVGHLDGPRMEQESALELPHWPKSWLDIRKQDSVYRLGTMLFATAIQPNFNYGFVPNNGVDLGPSGTWAGVLMSPDGGFTLSPSSLTPWFEVKNADPTVKHNVVGLFTSKKTLYIDVSDTNGGGSGEGQLTRLASTDGGRTWKRVGCFYYLPEAYHTMYTNAALPENLEENPPSIFGGPLRPFSLAPTSGCTYRHDLP